MTEPVGLGETDTTVAQACSLADSLRVDYLTALALVLASGGEV